MRRIAIGLSLALLSAPANAAVYVEDFSTGVSSATEARTSFLPFDVQLGQLEEESILLSGTASVSLGSGPAGIVVLVSDPDVTRQFGFFAFSGNPRAIPISIDWSFPASNSGPAIDDLEIEGISSDFNRVINDTPLRGEVEYFYAPNAGVVPEASSWVMLLVGFLGLGLRGAKRRRRVDLAQPFALGLQSGALGEARIFDGLGGFGGHVRPSRDRPERGRPRGPRTSKAAGPSSARRH
jgi:hypothetical protein